MKHISGFIPKLGAECRVYHSATIAAYSGNAVIIEDIIKGLMNNQLVEKVELQTDDLVRSEGKRSSQSITPGAFPFTCW